MECVLSSVISRRLSSIASFAAEHTSFTLLSRSRRPFFPRNSDGSKVISPPIRVLKLDVSKRVISLKPVLPWIKASQKLSFPIPMGDKTPMPVITISFSIKSPAPRLPVLHARLYIWIYRLPEIIQHLPHLQVFRICPQVLYARAFPCIPFQAVLSYLFL